MVYFERPQKKKLVPKDMDYKCVNCGNDISDAKHLYARRFCSEKCRDEYFSGDTKPNFGRDY